MGIFIELAGGLREKAFLHNVESAFTHCYKAIDSLTPAEQAVVLRLLAANADKQMLIKLLDEGA
jgi:hypothetical protein